jgi:organic radical activating enzyme
MLNGIHFLLTYICNYECDHCFLYCGPNSKGTFTLKQITQVLDEAVKVGTIEWIYWEGGEPFLFYPIMLEGIRLAKERGFKNGIVTNSYWATSIEDAEVWLKPLIKLEISDFSVSDDLYHFEGEVENLAKFASKAASNLYLPTYSIAIQEPTLEIISGEDQEKGKPVIGGGAKFRGRAVEKLIGDLPQRPWDDLTTCPYEDLEGLGRIHVDSYGNAQVCQGLSIGNFWKTPLSELIKNYNPKKHPMCGPLIEGGPAELVRKYDLAHKDTYVDECHLCYLARLALLDRFPTYLGPRQVYGLKD